MNPAPSAADPIFDLVSEQLRQTVGHRLFTVSYNLPGGREVQRIYSSLPDQYPVGGRSPVDQTEWTRQMERGEVFVANHPDAFGEHFHNLETIVAQGFGAVINIPINDGARKLGSLNLLDRTGAYGGDVLPACRAAAAAALAGFLAHERQHGAPATPFERGNGNQTTTWAECIAWYEELARRHPDVLRLFQIGLSDGGRPLYAGLISADGRFDREAIRAEGRCVFFNNNGIHPGEPEGIDVCMALVRDFCTQPERLARLGATVFLFIPVYNVDGCANRNSASRVNQLGPESFGFRGTDRHQDLNRDFVKCDSLSAQAFNRFFSAWDPEVMVDTHTSNGADYPYTMTLIHTQSDKLGGPLGAFLRETMLPALYGDMERRGWPTCPYVDPVQDTPDSGIAHMLDVPRFSTGYAALHHTIGFMPETHMLKPFADRYHATRALVESVLDFTLAHGQRIRALREQTRAQALRQGRWPLQWAIDMQQPVMTRFRGYQAVRSPSRLGQYTRLSYDRTRTWERDIPCYERAQVQTWIDSPWGYLVPQAWREVVERLQWNGVPLRRLAADQMLDARAWRIVSVRSRAHPYEGRLFHDEVQVEAQPLRHAARAGDWVVALDGRHARYVVETLEPQGHDSLFRWGFFNSILEQKERYSDYVFEDTAWDMLQSEPQLRAHFERWKADNPALLTDARAVLDFLFAHGERHHEPGWRRYPVLALAAAPD